MSQIMFQIKEKRLWLLVPIGIVLLDQFTKQWASDTLNYAQPQSFLPFFNFTLLYNDGAAFSLLSDAGGWQRWFFAIIALFVSVLLLVWILRLESYKKRELLGLSLILGGAIGNLWDRLVLGHVIDFIDWFYPSTSACLFFFYPRVDMQTCHWPAFNIADSAILLGVFLLIIDMFIQSKKGGEGA